MKTLLLGVLLVLVSAGIVAAQGKSSGQLDLEYKQRSPAVQPVPPRKIEEDTNQAVRELDRQRTEQILRNAQPTGPRRPDLERDVTQGIQSRGLSGR